MTPYEQLADMAHTEAELAREGRWAEMIELGRARDELIANLPDTPPAQAFDALTDAWRTARATAGQVSVSLAETRAALRALHEGRRAIGAYFRAA